MNIIRANLGGLFLLLHIATMSHGIAEERFPSGEAAINAWAKVVDARMPLKMSRKVLTPYYGWYANDGKWGAVVPEMMNNLTEGKGSGVWDRPLLGYYRSDDPSVIAAHCAWARSAGIDVLQVSCFRGLPVNLLTEAVKAGIQVAPYFEFIQEKQNASTYEPPGEKKYEYLMDVARTIARQAKEIPGSVYTIADKPVIFAYKRTLGAPATPAFWAEALLRLKAEGLEFIILGDESPLSAIQDKDQARKIRANHWMRIFDGMHNYHVLNHFLGNPDRETVQERCDSRYAQELKELEQRQRISCLTVMPGWDNRTVSPANGGMVVDRKNGALYEAMWNAALSQKIIPDLVMVTSFNEWMEGGTIEPSFSTGTRYLELTRGYSAKLRGQAQEDRQVTLALKPNNGLHLDIKSDANVASSRLSTYPGSAKNDPAVDLVEIVTKCNGVATFSNEQEKPDNATRILISKGSRATSAVRNDWYNGKKWDGNAGEWYYRFSGVARLEAVFGCHHVIVFLDGRTTCLADGVEVNLTYQPRFVSNGRADLGAVLVPLSLLVNNLNVPISTNRRDVPEKLNDPDGPRESTTQIASIQKLTADAAILNEWHPRLVEKLTTAIAKGKRIPLSGETGLFVKAVNLVELSAAHKEQSIRMNWRAITPKQKATMALNAAEGQFDAELYLIAAVYFAAADLQQPANECLVKAARIDSQRTDALQKQLRGNKGPGQ